MPTLFATGTTDILANVPLVMPACQGLGLSLTIPIHVGDECLLAVCDRSIDQWQMAGCDQGTAAIEIRLI